MTVVRRWREQKENDVFQCLSAFDRFFWSSSALLSLLWSTYIGSRLSSLYGGTCERKEASKSCLIWFARLLNARTKSKLFLVSCLSFFLALVLLQLFLSSDSRHKKVERVKIEHGNVQCFLFLYSKQPLKWIRSPPT